jgi:hypothetical protein
MERKRSSGLIAALAFFALLIEGHGVVREGAGGIHIAEFQQQGSHRQGKRVWEEYGYVWLARQVAK